MEIYISERPSALPAGYAPMSAARVILAADLPSGPRAHQAQAQVKAELILAVASTGNNGTTGFTGDGIQTSTKRMDVRGVPPRGRPV
jgi:hypothetical protein